MIVWAGALAYTLDGTSTFVTIPSAQSVYTAGLRVASTQYENHIFFGNGDASPYKYNGTDFTRHGVPQATGVVSALTNSAGTLGSASYSWKVTYENSQVVEGDVGTAVTIASVDGSRVVLTDIPVAPQSHGVNKRHIYRTSAAGATYYKVATLENNTATTYTDNINDDSLGVAAPTDNGEPPDYDVVEYHQNRIFCNDADNANYLWYSNLAEPYTFASTNFFRVGDKASDLITGLKVHQNNVYILCENSLWVLYMPSTTPSDWLVIRVSSSFGSKSPYAPFLFQDKLMFAAMQNKKFSGFSAVQGSTIDPGATTMDTMIIGSELRSEPIEEDMFDFQRAYLENVTSIVFKNKAYISATKGSGNTTNNRLYVFDFSLGRLSKNQRESWSRYDGINVSQMTVYDGKLYGGSSTANGLVYELETTSYTDGAGSTAIDSYFWTKEFAGQAGHENLIKDFRSVRIFVDKPGAVKMDVAIRVDSDKGAGLAYEIDLDPGSSLWGTASWSNPSDSDPDLWGGGRDQDEYEVFLGGISGRRIQFKFSNQNTASQRFKVYGLNFTYNIRGTT
jgi:hypothetical protein